MSGYCPCACPDCFEIAISGNDDKPAFCNVCEDAGCDDEGSCQAEETYADET